MAKRKPVKPVLAEGGLLPDQPQVKPLTDLEWTTCWMAVNYAHNGRTIACATLPQLLVEAYGKRWSVANKEVLLRILDCHRQTHEHFGDPQIDHAHWERFRGFLTPAAHRQITLLDESVIDVFDAGGEIVPLKQYLASPGHWYIVPPEHILN